MLIYLIIQLFEISKVVNENYLNISLLNVRIYHSYIIKKRFNIFSELNLLDDINQFKKKYNFIR